MKNLVGFVIGVLVTAAVALVQANVSLVQVGTVAAALAAVCWLLVVVVLPWNLVFQARHLVAEAERSRARGLPVDEPRVTDARRVSARMLKVAIGLHLGSAAVLGGAALLSGDGLAAVFAGLFLVSTVGRPAVVAYQSVKRRLTQSLSELSYPPADVEALIATVRRVEERVRDLQQTDVTLGEQCEGLTKDAHQQRERLRSFATQFEQTVERLTDQRELVSGLKAFVRLVRTS